MSDENENLNTDWAQVEAQMNAQKWHNRRAVMDRASFDMATARKRRNVKDWAMALACVTEALELWGNHAPPDLARQLQEWRDECDSALGGDEVVPVPPQNEMTVYGAAREVVAKVVDIIPKPPALPRLPSIRWRDKGKWKRMFRGGA